MLWTTKLGFDPEKIILIIHADDGGASEGHDAAILECHRAGVVTSASAMVYGGSFGNFAEKVAPHLGDVGIHLECGLNDSRTKGKIEQEFERQYYRFLERMTPTHIDTHGGVVFEAGPVFQSYLGFAKAKKVPALVTYRSNFIGNHLKGYKFPVMTDILMAPRRLLMESRLEWMKKALGGLYPGLYQLIVHPNVGDDPSGFSDYWALTQPAFRRFIKEDRFVLTTWGELSKRSYVTCLA